MFSQKTLGQLICDTNRGVSYLDMMTKNHEMILNDLDPTKSVIFNGAKATIADWKKAIVAAKAASVAAASGLAGAFLASHLRGSIETNKQSLRIMTLAVGIVPQANESDTDLLTRFRLSEGGNKVWNEFQIKTAAEIEAERLEREAEKALATKRARLAGAIKALEFMDTEKTEAFIGTFSEEEQAILRDSVPQNA